MSCSQLNAENFWDTDLEDIESVFLKKGTKITDLPTTLDNRVPSQGSVLLKNTVNIDKIVKQPSLIKRLAFRFS